MSTKKTKKPVAKKPVAKKPVAKKPVAKKPVAKKPLVHSTKLEQKAAGYLMAAANARIRE